MKEPKIRFKGFSGEWKSSNFEEVFSPLKNNSLSRADLSESGDIANIHYGDVLIKYGECVDTSVDDLTYIIDHDTAQRLLRNCALQKGDVIFADAAEDNTVGKCSELICKDNERIVSGLHTIACRPKIKIADRYFGYYLNSPAFHNQLLPHIQGTKISSISRRAINTTSVLYPDDKGEQISLPSFFTSLDAQISASTSRLASLKQMKAASLQAMFPQEGETVPKVRFKEFKGEWDKQSASDLFLSIDERNRPELPVLSACQDIRGMIPREKIGFNVSHDTSNEVTYKRVKPGQFVIHLRSFQGGFAHSSYDGIISPAYTVFDFKDKERHDDYYWKIVFMSRAFIDRLRLITYGIRDGRSINFDEFKNLLFLFPSKEEQHAIATFFRSLDRQIALHTQRLEKLKQIKAACLDKMFV